MKIDTSTIPGPAAEFTRTTAKKTDFVDSLKEAVSQTNASLKDAGDASMALARGEAESIHDAMIRMQKANISLRLLVKSTNKIIEGYKELTRLS